MSEIRVDTISEKTSANGVAIDGVTLKDNGITISQDISHLDNAGNSRILYDRSENLLGNTGTNLTGATLFIGGTGSANQLDDYEEGVYNPTLTDSAGNVTSIALNSSFDTLAYTKVGRKVTIGGAIVVSSFSGSWGSGQCQISLPFVVANLSEASGRSTGTVGTFQVDFTAGTAPYLITSEGNSYCVIQTSGDNITGGNGQPTNSAQLYIGLTYFTT